MEAKTTRYKRLDPILRRQRRHTYYLKQKESGLIQKSTSARRAKLRQRVTDLKIGKPCVDCKFPFHFSAMDFDHRPGTVKLFTLAQSHEHSLDEIKAEIAKCDLVCSNCHRVRTWKRNNPQESE